MRYDSYKEIPLRLFIKVLNDPAQLGILGGVDKKTWKVWAEKFEAENPSPETEQILERQHLVMKPSALLQKYAMLAKACTISPQKWEEFFEAAEAPILDTLDDSLSWVERQVKRERTAFNIRKAEYERFAEELKENKNDDDHHDIYDLLASMGAITGKHYRYHSITVGEFFAEQRLCEKIASKNGGQGREDIS